MAVDDIDATTLMPLETPILKVSRYDSLDLSTPTSLLTLHA